MRELMYFEIVPTTRQAVISKARKLGRIKYCVAGGLSEDNLNWITELGPGNGFTQVSMTKDGERAVLMDVHRVEEEGEER